MIIINFKISVESSTLLQRIKKDIHRPIHPQNKPFKYCIVLIDAPTSWSHVTLLSTHNVVFAGLLVLAISFSILSNSKDLIR